MAIRKKLQPGEKDLFEELALEVGYWKKINGQTTDNPEYGYTTLERVKIDFEDWKKKKYPKSK